MSGLLIAGIGIWLFGARRKSATGYETQGFLAHSHDDEHDHDHEHNHNRLINVEQDALLKNNLLAERNRGFLEAKNIKSYNLVSSPGSGKTSILEKIIPEIKKTIPVYVIEGDQQTMNDAERINKTGASVVQINTGNGCHLDAHMINHAISDLSIENNSVLFIENVGNLVCPALFDLGENKRIVILSVTEGDDKPLKYPNMFNTSQLCVINKTDLLPYVDFNLKIFKENARKINPGIQFVETSAKTSEGLKDLIMQLI